MGVLVFVIVYLILGLCILFPTAPVCQRVHTDSYTFLYCHCVSRNVVLSVPMSMCKWMCVSKSQGCHYQYVFLNPSMCQWCLCPCA